MHSFNTIKGKLLIAFSSLTLIIIFLSGSTFWYLRKGQQIHNEKDLATLIYNKSLQLFKIDLIVLNEFHLNNHSVELPSDLNKKRTSLNKDIDFNFVQLHNINNINNINIDEDLYNLKKLIDQYNLEYFQLVESEKENASIINNREKIIIQIDNESENFSDENSNNILTSNTLFLQQGEIEKSFDNIIEKIIHKHQSIQQDEKLIFIISVIYSILLCIFLVYSQLPKSADLLKYYLKLWIILMILK
ncbi:MAG: hypothetical protein M3421_08975 [Bacteroidota bacterium]|nr:hypothetical protein [Bacteroidota bacterium]